MKKTISLNGTWQWQEVGQSRSFAGMVPGSVLTDMLRLGMIPDPFWRRNEYGVRELMMRDYICRREFQLEACDLEADEIRLVCEGLDTIAHITLNGVRIADVNDMHRRYSFDVKANLKPANKKSSPN